MSSSLAREIFGEEDYTTPHRHGQTSPPIASPEPAAPSTSSYYTQYGSTVREVSRRVMEASRAHLEFIASEEESEEQDDLEEEEEDTIQEDIHPLIGTRKRYRRRLFFMKQIARYTLFFVHFLFLLASVLLVYAGAVLSNTGHTSLTDEAYNTTVQQEKDNNHSYKFEVSASLFCSNCASLGRMAVILGTLLGLTTIGSFIEYKSRQILLWLLHGAFLILWFIALTVLLGMTVWTEVRLFHRLREKDQTKNLEVSVVLDRWETAVWYSRHNDNNNHNVSNKTEDVIPSTWLCELQQRFNCTGFVHGCCIPELCYDLSAIPDYFYQVCPFCPPSDEAYYVYNKSNPDDGELVSNTTFYFGNQTCTTLITSNIHYHVLAFTIVVVVSYVLLWCGVALLYFTRQSSASLRRWGSTIVVEGG